MCMKRIRGYRAFLGLNGEYIEGIFRFGAGAVARHREVSARLCQGQKAGVAPETCIRRMCGRFRFYRREGFQIRRSGLDAATGEPDYGNAVAAGIGTPAAARRERAKSEVTSIQTYKLFDNKAPI